MAAGSRPVQCPIVTWGRPGADVGLVVVDPLRAAVVVTDVVVDDAGAAAIGVDTVVLPHAPATPAAAPTANDTRPARSLGRHMPCSLADGGAPCQVPTSRGKWATRMRRPGGVAVSVTSLRHDVLRAIAPRPG